MASEQTVGDRYERAADAVALLVAGAGPARGGAAPSGTDVSVPAEPAARVRAVTGHDVRDVRLHTGAVARELTGRLGCRAVSSGRHVFLAPGEHPGTPAGDMLVAHELAHVVQQATDRRPRARRA